MERKMDFRVIFKSIKYLVKSHAVVNVECIEPLGVQNLSGQFKLKKINNEFKWFFIGKNFELPINVIKYGNINNEFELTTKKNGKFINAKLFNECLNEIQINISKNQQKYFNKLYPDTPIKVMKIFNFCQDRCNIFIGNGTNKLIIKNVILISDIPLSNQITKNKKKINKYYQMMKQLNKEINKLQTENDILIHLL